MWKKEWKDKYWAFCEGEKRYIARGDVEAADAITGVFQEEDCSVRWVHGAKIPWWFEDDKDENARMDFLKRQEKKSEMNEFGLHWEVNVAKKHGDLRVLSWLFCERKNSYFI